MIPLSPRELQLLQLIPSLSDNAMTPVKCAALYRGVSEKTIRREFPIEKISTRLSGVRIGYLRHGPEWKTGSPATGSP